VFSEQFSMAEQEGGRLSLTVDEALLLVVALSKRVNALNLIGGELDERVDVGLDPGGGDRLGEDDNVARD
jgi:hypothetical protein